MENKLKTLSEIAAMFNRAGVTWALGASGMLFFSGITDSFNDIDIMIAEDDVETVKQLMGDAASLKPAGDNTGYKTRYFLEYSMGGVDVDIMAGFAVVNGENEHYFPLESSQISGYACVCGEKIPLHDVSLWRRFYELIGRENKVRMIDDAAFTAKKNPSND